MLSEEGIERFRASAPKPKPKEPNYEELRSRFFERHSFNGVGPEMKAKPEPTYAELMKQFLKKLYSDYYFRPPDSVVLIPVSQRIADAVRANPEGVRVSVKTNEGVVLFEGPKLGNKAGMMVQVAETKEVDKEGLPIWWEPVEVE